MVQRVPKVPAMPKRAAKLKPEEIGDLIEWVRAGAPWPASKPGDAKPGASASASRAQGLELAPDRH